MTITCLWMFCTVNPVAMRTSPVVANNNSSQQSSQQSNDKGKEAFDNVPSFLHGQACSNTVDFNDDSTDSWNLPPLNAKNQPAELQQHYQAAVEVASPSSQTP